MSKSASPDAACPGFRFPGILRHQGDAAARPGADAGRARTCRRRRCSPATACGRRRCCCRRLACTRAAPAAWWSTAATPTPAPARGRADAAAMAALGRGRGRASTQMLVASRASSASSLPRRARLPTPARAGGAAGSTVCPVRRRRSLTTDKRPKARRSAHVALGQTHGARWSARQGRRDDRAQHGDHAGLRRHRRGGRARRCMQALVAEAADHLQPHHRRRRHLDQRLLPADRHRRGPASARSTRLTMPTARSRRGDRGARRSSRADRARRRGRDQVRHHRGEAAQRAECRARRRRDRALAAGEDGVLRRRSQLGPHPRARSATPASISTRQLTSPSARLRSSGAAWASAPNTPSGAPTR